MPRAKEVLARLAKDSPHAEVRGSALFSLAALTLENAGGDAASIEQARLLFRRVAAEFPKTPFAERAEAALYEAEHLQVGLSVPDFETVDENGKSWKLSDYRGKVVVIDFWGNW